MDIQGIHDRLLSFSSVLDVPPGGDETTVNASAHSAVLKSLVKECRDCCERLLTITQKLQVKDDSKVKWWKSFEKALYEAWKKDDVEQLKSRLRGCQTEMSLRLCAISRCVNGIIISNSAQDSIQANRG